MISALAGNVLYPDTVPGAEGIQAQASNSLYHRSLARGRRGQILSMLAGRSRCLLRLADVEANLEVHDRSDAGVQTVPIERIRGSGDRAHDFDRDFCPLQSYTQARWLGIATAHQQGVTLPPVALIQIGDIYFVQDGHHRISVARARGQRDIEARVTAWQVSGTLPWEAPVKAPSDSPTGQSIGITYLAGLLRRIGTQLGKRFQPGRPSLLDAVGKSLRAWSGGDDIWQPTGES